MMQEFKPDCTINLHLESRGRPGKNVWACSIVDRSGRRLVTALRFAGAMGREAAMIECANFGMSQAQRLRMEKVELASDGTIDSMLVPERIGGKRSKELQSILKNVSNMWIMFRLRKVGVISPEERDYLRGQANSLLKR